jgi:hypothetical protein
MSAFCGIGRGNSAGTSRFRGFVKLARCQTIQNRRGTQPARRSKRIETNRDIGAVLVCPDQDLVASCASPCLRRVVASAPDREVQPAASSMKRRFGSAVLATCRVAINLSDHLPSTCSLASLATRFSLASASVGPSGAH